MRQVLGAGALGRPRGVGWRGRWKLGSGWGIHVNPWLIHVNVWQKPLQHCKVISLQLIKINGRKKKKKLAVSCYLNPKFKRPTNIKPTAPSRPQLPGLDLAAPGDSTWLSHQLQACHLTSLGFCRTPGPWVEQTIPGGE